MPTDNTTSPKLQHFRQILFWPLRLIPPEGDKTKIEKNGFAEYMREKLSTTSANWCSQNDLYNRGTASEEITRYAELVYFHPFIQRFLYDNASNFEGKKKHRPVLQICRRTDVSKLKITLREGQELKFDVDRIHLYVFDIEVAILVMEISSQTLADNTNLGQIQDFLDQFRRAYPPYWDRDDAGHSPQVVKFLGNNNELLVEGQYNEPKDYLSFVRHYKISPVAEHWKFLLNPFVPYERFNVNTDKVRYLQIEDERIPYMAYFAFDDPRLLTNGDMMRLGFAESSGNSDSLPYSSQFAKQFERDYCYDRFWENDRHEWMNTRYICCGYAFTMIGTDEPYFFSDGKVGALAHFRHHYFQMGLIAHFHKAALLMLWDDLAQAVAKFSKDRQSRQQFHDEVRDILEKLLHFTHRYWFTEVSNQIQAKELFDMWSKHLGSRELFDRVMKEAQDAHQYLEMDEQKQQTDTTVRLTVVATVGLIFVLTLTFFSTPLGQNLLSTTSKQILEWGWVFIILIICGFGVSVTLYFSEQLSGFIDAIAKKRFWRSIWQWFKGKRD